MALQLLAVGDLHLGRRPSRLPEGLAGGDRARALGPAGAWQRVVDAAIDNGVDAVVLAGDLVDREDDFFEAYRELYRGVKQLFDAGIRVCGVAGNHDVQVLPRLADEIDAFTLLGRDGHWESIALGSDREPLTLWGWSFPEASVRHSPLAGQRFELARGVNLGLLHCDRNQPGSAYAPVSSGELEGAGLDGWLLGHIHQPDPLQAPHPTGYLGSVTGLDPGEPGARGPWLLTLDGGRIEQVVQWPLAPLQWRRMDVDIGGIEAPEEARAAMLHAVTDLDASLSATRWPPAAVGLRITLTGRSRHGEAVCRAFSDGDREHLTSGAADTHYFIERLESATRPEIALETLAGRQDPPGLLARRLLLLDAPDDDPDRRRLLDAARGDLRSLLAEPRFAALRDEVDPDAVLQSTLRRSGMYLLESLLAQHEREP